MRRGLWFAAIAAAALTLAGCGQTTGGGPALSLVEGPGDAATSGLSPSAQKKLAEAEYRALEFGKAGVPIAWRDGESHGEVTPGPLYQVNAYNCRDYTHTVVIGSQPPQSGRATACRQANGAWQAVT